LRLTGDEIVVQNGAWPSLFFGKYRLAKTFQQRDVAVDPDLQKQIGKRGTATYEPKHVLRMFEASHARFWERVNMHERGSIAFRTLQ